MVPKSPPGATYPPERPIARNSERQECGSTSRRCPDAADSGSTGSGHRRTGDRLRSACRQSPGDVSNDAVPPMTRGHASPKGVHRQRNQRPEGQRGDEPCQREAEAPAKSLLKVVPEPGKGTGSLRARRSPGKSRSTPRAISIVGRHAPPAFAADHVVADQRSRLLSLGPRVLAHLPSRAIDWPELRRSPVFGEDFSLFQDGDRGFGLFVWRVAVAL